MSTIETTFGSPFDAATSVRGSGEDGVALPCTAAAAACVVVWYEVMEKLECTLPISSSSSV